MGNDPATGQRISGDNEAQTERGILSVKAVPDGVGLCLDAAFCRNIHIIDTKESIKLTQCGGDHFDEPYPVSTCEQVSGMANEGARVELKIVAEFR